MLKSTLFVLIFSFFIATIIGPFFIPFLHRLKFGQAIREEGPQSHRKKSGTPTMGGIIFITSIVVVLLATVFFTNYVTMGHELMMLLLTLVGFGAIGFVDDFIIVVRKNNEGLKPKQKLLAQLVLAAVFFYMFLKNGYSTELSFFNLFSPDLYWIYGLFILFWMVGFSNAVNLTDGLDGLCGGVSVITFGTFGMIALAQQQIEIALFCFAVVGGLFGFLVFNLNPAKVFMGDTGSLALGAAIAAVSILLKQELLLVVIGLVYVIETLSVIIQVAYYKRTHKRIFKMAPIHHHFELCGWSEWKVVSFLWAIALVCGVIGVLIVI
ncbi:MAG: phospho-N-acetylmuramoyl-pentapeptide-transferase [Turicibacter sp.]|nr:phospho-N-acetylmuramoyl-pentapeptide-transferase [Turicibacter sp.]